MSDPRTTTVGFIGLGLLGQAMALRLQSQGFEVVGWNREPERQAMLIEAGASIAASPGEVAERCGVLCLCVLDATAVRDVMFGPRGVVHASTRVRTVLDFSTVDPAQTRAIAGEALAAGIDWIDAPVSGGPVAAKTGALTVMVGGRPEAVQGVERILNAVAARVTHLGPAGAGQAMKVVNQALVGGTFVLLAEAMALARELGLPAASVPSCLAGGMADSVALQQAWPRMVREDFTPPTGRASQMLKDLECVDRLRELAGLNLPLLETASEQYRNYVDGGAGDDETVSITRLYAPRSGR
jgi:3-hydroxyisobutyrate dehydrogenase